MNFNASNLNRCLSCFINLSENIFFQKKVMSFFNIEPIEDRRVIIPDFTFKDEVRELHSF